MTDGNGYIPSEYLPGDRVLAMHNLPRFSGGNTFDAANEEYLKGVALIAIPFALLGLLLSLIVLCITCCKSKDHAPEKHRSVCCPWFLSVFFLALVFLGVIIAGNGNEVAAGAVDSAQAALTSVQSFLTQATSLAQQTGATAQSSSAALKQIEDDCPQVATEVADFRARVDELATSVNNFSVADLMSSLQSVSDPIDEYETTRYNVIVAGLVFVFMIVAIYALGLLQLGALHKCSCLTSCFACLGCLLLLFSVFVIMFMWVTTGLGILVSTFLADFCVAPDVSFRSVVGLAGNASSVEYYQTCQGLPPASVTGVLANAEQLIIDANASLTNLDDAGAICTTNIDPLITELYGYVDDAQAILNDADALVACQNVNPVYSQFIDEFLCTDLIGSLVQFWVGAFFIGFFLTFLQLSFRVLTHRRQESELLREEDARSGGGASRQGKTTRLDEVEIRERY